MRYDALVDVILGAPGRSAAWSALATLRQLASGGDFAAVLSTCQVVAHELGLDADTAGLRSSRSLTELVEASDTAPLVRIYALGFLPRQLLANAAILTELGRAATATADLGRFQLLVRRNAPAQDEVLKAYIICAFLGIYGAEYLTDHVSGGAKLAVLDQILANAKVVPGDAADATFEFGADVIMAQRTATSLGAVIGHELGHHLLDALLAAGGRSAEGAPSGPGTFGELGAALPGLVEAAARAEGLALQTDDPRRWRSASGLSVLCTWQRTAKGAYTHFSMTLEAGPIDTTSAGPLAYYVLRLVGADPARAAVVESSRGVFHFGVEGGPVSSDEVRARIEGAPGALVDDARSDWTGWFAALESAGRVGAAEPEVRYILGVEARPPAFYGLDPDTTWPDLDACGRIRAGVDLTGIDVPPAELLRLAVRCGDPDALALVLAARPPVPPLDLGLRDLGRSACVVRSGAAVTYLGPTVPDLRNVLSSLHTHGFPLNEVVTDDGETLLTNAAARSADLVAFLVSVGASADAPNTKGETPLSVAAWLGNAGIATLLLDAGASVSTRDADGLTPLHRAAVSGDADLVADLLDRGADPHARAKRGDTPLAATLSPLVVSLLCRAGADPNAATNARVTPLMRAAQRGLVGVVRSLLSAGADATAANDLGHIALHFVTEAPRNADARSTIHALLDAGADVDEEANDGITALMAAAMNARDDLVGYLLEFGAAVDLRTVSGNTALILASDGQKEWSGDVTRTTHMEECIRLLVGAGADVNARNDSAETALHWATTGFHAGPVELLLQLGADPNAATNTGITPLASARKQNHQKMIEDLVAAGADASETP